MCVLRGPYDGAVRGSSEATSAAISPDVSRGRSNVRDGTDVI